MFPPHVYKIRPKSQAETSQPASPQPTETPEPKSKGRALEKTSGAKSSQSKSSDPSGIIQQGKAQFEKNLKGKDSLKKPSELSGQTKTNTKGKAENSDGEKKSESASQTQRLKAQFEKAHPGKPPNKESELSKPSIRKFSEPEKSKVEKPTIRKFSEGSQPAKNQEAKANSLQRQTSIGQKPPLASPPTPTTQQRQHPFQKKETSFQKPGFQKQNSTESEVQTRAKKPGLSKQTSQQETEPSSSPVPTSGRKLSFGRQATQDRAPPGGRRVSFQRQSSQEGDAPSSPKHPPLKKQTSGPFSRQKKAPGMATECEWQDQWRKGGAKWGSEDVPDSPTEDAAASEEFSKNAPFRLKPIAKKDNVGSSSWKSRRDSKGKDSQDVVDQNDADWPDDEPETDATTKSAKEFFGVPLKKVPLKDKWEKRPSSPTTPPAKDVFKVTLKKVPDPPPEKLESKRRPASWCEEVQLKPVPEDAKKKKVRIVEEESESESEEEETEEEESEEENENKKSIDVSGVPPPPPPPGPPPPPCPPLPPHLRKAGPPKRDPKKDAARKRLVEQIKKASRSRPDWMSVMKDVEGGVKLRRVRTEDKLDRSKPVLPDTKSKEGTFIYESEKPKTKFNKLMKDIQVGVKLRHVKTNDRSKPDFNRLGLRKLRRQRTCDEMKKIDPDAPEALPSSSDEDEDIDNMRDDLQSTKAQLADEIKKSKMKDRETKILKIDLDSLKADVKKLKRQLKEAGVQEVKAIKNCPATAMAPQLSKSMSKLRLKEEEIDFSELDVIDEEIDGLKGQIDAQQKRAEKAEQKVEELTQKLRLANNSSDEWEMRSIYFEKKFKALQKEQGIELPEIACVGLQTDPIEIPMSASGSSLATRRSSSKKSFGSIFTRMESFKEEDEDSASSSSEEEDEEEEEESEEEQENNEEKSQENEEKGESKRKEKELKVWKGKLKQAKEKEKNLKHDRSILRDKILKIHQEIKNEREAYLKVKKELEEMAEMLKEATETENEGEENKEEEEEDERKKKNKKKPTKYNLKIKGKNEEEESEDEDEESEEEEEESEEEEEESEEEETEESEEEDVDELKTPEFSSSESESDSEIEEDFDSALNSLQRHTQRHEDTAADLRKENAGLKTQADRCNEMFQQEKRRHARLDNELQMLVTAIE